MILVGIDARSNKHDIVIMNNEGLVYRTSLLKIQWKDIKTLKCYPGH